MVTQVRIDRVVVNEFGEAVSLKRAVDEFNVKPDIIFVRDDGWCLGAPALLEKTAYRIWRDSWTHFWRRGDENKTPISEYR